MNAPNADTNGELTVISLFAGCGGSSLGYQMAGYRELLAVDFDAKITETFRLNFPGVPVWVRDINSIEGQEVLDFCRIQRGELDILDGSPPCQGFSICNRNRYRRDGRNNLPLEYARLLRELYPKVFIMENVAGMVRGIMKGFMLEALRTFSDAGYKVKARIMNAVYYGVPQLRERLIFMGVRDDLGIEPQWPSHNGKIAIAREAIGHLPIGKPGGHRRAIILAWNSAKPGQSLRKSRIKYVGSFNSCRLNPDRPCPTQIASHLHWHWLIPRHLTLQEAGMLQGFPSDFKWIEPRDKKAIGNSVPPPMIRAIAECVKDRILCRH